MIGCGFFSVLPFVCLVAGRGIAVIISSLRPSLRSIGMIIILSAWMVTVYQSVIRIHPWESAYTMKLSEVFTELTKWVLRLIIGKCEFGYFILDECK